jgi:hypothetical protein
MITHPVIFYDRSRVTTDWRCPQSRYLAYEWGGTGLAEETLALELYTGTVLHDGLAAIMAGTDIDLIADAARDQMKQALVGASEGTDYDRETFANEQAALAEGLLRGFHKHVYPQFQILYDVVAMEKELIYNHDQFTGTPLQAKFKFMAKPDLIVRDKDGQLWYIEYKSTSSAKDTWVNSWNMAVQLHSTIRAVEEELGEKVTGVIVQGLYKGYVSYGKQNSPFCYAYHKPGNPPFTKDMWSYSYAPGYKRYPVWEREGGVKAWVANMPEDILIDQFPTSPPIFIKDELVDAFFQQRAHRELEIHLASKALQNEELEPDLKQQITNMSFPQRFDQCQPSFGKACQFRRICHGQVSDPLSQGFTRRQPHHQPELDAWNAARAADGAV